MVVVVLVVGQQGGRVVVVVVRVVQVERRTWNTSHRASVDRRESFTDLLKYASVSVSIS